ncbi:HAD-IA family hydrolase [SAR92 clade bacterium H921]|nr:HAD-IA family hydrolase [SAR92 clade bacterium H921]
MSSKLLIFDWDGTLSDSVARISTCMQLAAEDQGLAVPDFNAAKEIIGLGLQEAITQLFPDASADMVARFSASYSAHYREQDQQPCAFFPGVLSSLKQLRAQGYLLAVATGKSRAGLNRVLLATGLNDFFHSSRCADETKSKPHPLMLQELLAEQGASPEQAIMVGDTEFDMQMAVNAQVPRIAVSYGAHDAQRLYQFSPLACIDHFGDIINHL